MRGNSQANCIDSNAHELNKVLIAATEQAMPIASALRASGLSVLEARAGADVLALAAQHPVALLVATERLPDMRGAEIARAAFEQHGLYSVLIAEDSSADAPPYPPGVIAQLSPTTGENLVPTIRALFSLARELKSTRAREQELRAALAAEREINTAIGMLMERLNVSRENAFERLRSYARSQRKRLADVSGGLLGNAEESKRITAELIGIDATARQGTVLGD
jgi:AmiR/NasT family two-component response regulator